MNLEQLEELALAVVRSFVDEVYHLSAYEVSEFIDGLSEDGFTEDELEEDDILAVRDIIRSVVIKVTF